MGRRARLLVSHARVDGDDDPDRRLAAAVEGVDPAEVISLADALDTFLETPLDGTGDDDGLPFSPDARVRFARLAAELRDLRRSLADPLMDVLHRVLAVTGLEVELSASPHALAARRRETLSNFLDVAASFAASDNEATLLAFLAFLRTAAQYEKGLDNALPGGENTVKVLTAHKSKGLEWDVVAVPGLVTGTFPSSQGREKWTAQAKVLPHALRGDADTLPDVDSWDARGLKAFHEAMKDHQHTEELRLGYVTFTRPPLPAPRLRPLVGAHPEEAARPVRLPPRPVRALRRRARRDRGLGRRTRGGRGEPRPAPRHRRPGLAPAAGRGGPRPPPRRRRDGPRPPGHPHRPAARHRPRRHLQRPGVAPHPPRTTSRRTTRSRPTRTSPATRTSPPLRRPAPVPGRGAARERAAARRR
ncbi:hypothetical protein GCM10020256_24760 [Streptomyces thermocoprophilus]